MKKFGFIILSVLVLSACSNYASNGEALYLRSKNGQKLVVPPPLTDNNISHFYDLPAQNQNAMVNIAPPSDPSIVADAT
ncbi:hypothetical protein [Legionella jamestowniensis]|uniref:Outer membrane protein assembly factor BamC n=1 Tax=Legionella jamestowniensis TaxID=455 RepID=A0A0W0UX37_9GAMM|nr:hypothetical protein [Legionella jamestowniensis]KTD12205.1 hypothetical protein Ljam_0320 [Legionella jamestowniensis]OCH96810.1 hypothetical protein A8135_03990 [Legionella jamestowniensis]SFM02879.1 hypothetical protein SAMN02746073_0009 [Legionella jamestowniensis DSM 19215]